MTEKELEKENKLIKSFLYCTKRSCNNCGKVNCENFQRQRIDCCDLWVSFKDYIADLEEENEKLRGCEHIVQKMKEYGEEFDTFMSVKEFLQKHIDLEEENEDLKFKLDYAKAIIRDLLDNSNEYARQNAEDFIRESV